MFPIIPANTANSVGASQNPTGIFAYGNASEASVVGGLGVSNLVSDVGVVGSDVAAIGGNRAKYGQGACEYGEDKAIMAYGYDAAYGVYAYISWSNLITNVGVVGSDVSGVGTARGYPAGATFGGDRGIIFGGNNNSGAKVGITNLITNLGVVGTDVAAVGTARVILGGCEFGTNKDEAIFGFGSTAAGLTAITNLVSNTGVVASDTTE